MELRARRCGVPNRFAPAKMNATIDAAVAAQGVRGMEFVPLFLVIAVLMVGYPQQSALIVLTLVALRVYFRR